MTSQLTPTTIHPNVTAARRLATVTVADGLMAVIGLLAVWLRFGELARLPLSAAEATAALASFDFWTAGPMTTVPTSPAYFTFTNLIMGLGGDGDAAARFVPALFGVLTVLLPWLWRGRARPLVWLAAALFMAVSPLLTAVSRTAGGDAIALFALLLLVVAGLDDGAGRGRAVALGVALGLGLTTSPLFYTGLVALIIPAIIWFADDEPRAWLGRHFKVIALSAAIAFLAVATSLLLYPAGIGAALRIFPQWIGQFALPSGEWVMVWDFLSSMTEAMGGGPLVIFLIIFSIFTLIGLLLVYEPAVILLGLPAIVWALGRANEHGSSRTVALAMWAVILPLIVALQMGDSAQIAAILLPGYLLVGTLAAAVFASRDPYRFAEGRMFWSTAVGLMGLGALVLAAFGRFARLNLLTGEHANLITLAALTFVLAGLAVVVAMAWESAAARRGAFVGLVVLLLFWQWGSAWQLSRAGANDPRERWVTEATDDGATVMVNALQGVSRQITNSERDLRIFSLVESPVLDWYLRHYTVYQSGPTAPLDSQADVVIAPDGAELALPNDYFGADFALTVRELPPAAPPTLSDTLKWLLFRESAAPLETDRVVLWIRSDLVR